LDNTSEHPQPPPELPPLVIPRHHAQTNEAENNEDEEATLYPVGDVNVALRRASSSVRSDKMKNSSNKNKERTSIAGAIVKLLEQQQPSADSEHNEKLEVITMTIMRQMENLNKSMDDCNCQERKQQKKKCAKKRARKRKKRHALEGLNNHGGKAGGGGEVAAAAAAKIAAATIAAVMIAERIKISDLNISYLRYLEELTGC
jgi:hypothetical protein